MFVGLKGGSFGFQIGGQSADVVLVFVNKDAQRLASSTFDIGAGASVAAGPVGRNVSAETDYKAKAEIYSYSKTKGLFAGVSLSGTKWESRLRREQGCLRTVMQRFRMAETRRASLLC